MLKAVTAQPTAVRTGFVPQTHRQFRAAELTADLVSGIWYLVSGIWYLVSGINYTPIAGQRV
jgi:hypothetical protein